MHWQNKAFSFLGFVIATGAAVAFAQSRLGEISAPGDRNAYLAEVCRGDGSETTPPDIASEKIRRELGESACMGCHMGIHPHVATLFRDPFEARDVLNRSHISGGTFFDHAATQLRDKRMPPQGFGVGHSPPEIEKNDQDRRDALVQYFRFIKGDISSVCESNSKSGGLGKPTRSRPTLQ